MICCDSCGCPMGDQKVGVVAKQRYTSDSLWLANNGVTKECNLELCPACWDSAITFLKNRRRQ